MKPYRLNSKEGLGYGTLFILLWLLLTQGDMNSWLIGAFVVPLATCCALHVFPKDTTKHHCEHWSRRPLSLIRFIPFFLEQSLKGGWESALYAIHPGREVKPGVIRYQMLLPPGSARLFFINVVSLLPGTVSAYLCRDTIAIHVLDRQADNAEALRRCEMKVAQLFDLESCS